MEKHTERCLFCTRQANVQWEPTPDKRHFTCANCGQYVVALNDYSALPPELETRYETQRHLLSGLLREHTERGLTPMQVTVASLPEMLQSAWLPKTVEGKLEKLLLYLYRRTTILGEHIAITYNNEPAIAYAKTGEELENMLRAVEGLGYVTGHYMSGGGIATLTVRGIAFGEQQQTTTQSSQCFVAMWFDPTIAPVYTACIRPAVESAGFACLRIDEKPHNDKICDQIVAEIRRSHFLIADFSGHRGGVYYEAGLAAGLGLPVIYTCRKDFVDSLHFDVRQYNCVVWEEGKEEGFREQLKYRILATIPGAQERAAPQ
ncbi:Uncharacterised protein [uncultured archaeon]|nr:Uncharacterised protein [uncultured archaeon]